MAEISIDNLGKAIQADPAAVLLIEGDMHGIQVESESLKVIRMPVRPLKIAVSGML